MVLHSFSRIDALEDDLNGGSELNDYTRTQSVSNAD
jgi:hypothetical protein